MPEPSTQNAMLTGSERTRARISPLTALAVLGISYILNSMDRQALPALLGEIRRDYQITLAQGGLLSTVFAINIAIFGACGAWFMKRFGRRATMVGGILSYSLFTCLTPLASSFAGLATYRALTGAGEALHICAMFSCVGAYFGARRGAAIGAINACFGIGAFLGPVLATYLLSQTGSWRLPLYSFGIAGIGVALLVWLMIPKEFSEARDLEGVVADPQSAGSPPLLFNRNLLVSALSFALIGFSFFAFTSLYATYLRTELGYSTADASALFGLYGIGSLGGFFCGWLGDKWGKYGLLAVTLALSLVGFLLFHGPTTYAAQGMLSLCFGLLVSGYLYPRFVSVLQRNVPASHVNYATPIAMVSFYTPGLIAGYLFGRLIESFGWSAASLLVIALPSLFSFLLTTAYRSEQARGA
jgi:predicted MFS family arabinose efflux permease